MSTDIFGIGIETSCDETGIALIKNGNQIIANPLFSQIKTHMLYGGVVPEMASRLHLEKFPSMLEDLMKYREFREVSYIAVTVQPGLIGSLLIGYHIALALKKVLNVPLIPIHHLEAHLYASQLTGKILEYPFLGLLLSGGNSAIYRVDGLGNLSLLGDTLDDACGEAFDKAAAMLHLPYPGGPEIEKQAYRFAQQNVHGKISNPLPVLLRDQPKNKYQFSYSGLKTALYYFLQNNPSYDVNFICWCFQERAFEIVEKNIKNAIENTGIRKLSAAGGVMANQNLKKRLSLLAEKNKFEFITPCRELCTDNGAMIGALGFLYYQDKPEYDYQNVISSKPVFNS
ncbi:MAG: tRNA (adenosine(37)-N6)-threonylcarbamoyltransferase complex transferase subunit TsaD [Spirochaetia bacterium]|nr:tRNA (adenosine(37)-N6)-threonylcarbamoyltransferase complex transferase subunit TsaD [Spirochaetia bacterium]